MQESENHAVIQKLRSIGCDFGPCVNAYTGMEETVYEFLIPTDEPEFLPQILDTVAQFAFKVRCAPSNNYLGAPKCREKGLLYGVCSPEGCRPAWA